jgi:hypothetical protein
MHYDALGGDYGGAAIMCADLAAMRHSSIDLTMNVYTDPTLLDVAGAVEALPELQPRFRYPEQLGHMQARHLHDPMLPASSRPHTRLLQIAHGLPTAVLGAELVAAGDAQRVAVAREDGLSRTDRLADVRMAGQKVCDLRFGTALLIDENTNYEPHVLSPRPCTQSTFEP